MDVYDCYRCLTVFQGHTMLLSGPLPNNDFLMILGS
jgi:hypothetical protein